MLALSAFQAALASHFCISVYMVVHSVNFNLFRHLSTIYLAEFSMASTAVEG
jgi:hypothetical protein